MKYLIVGFGNIGRKRQAALGSKCIATLDPDPNQKADFTKPTQIPKKVLDQITAVAIVTSQKPKYNLVKYWLNKGKHVLIEKPLFFNDGGRELKIIADKNNVIWQTSYNHRFEPNIIKIKKLLDKNTIGPLYHARFVYSFGNIQERIGTWRETKYGVLEEIAPHVVDFALYFFGYQGKDFEPWIARKNESKIYDHWVFATKDKKVIFENSSVTWKNIFSVDIYGKKGSIHMNGLRKWGGSELLTRKRVLPSGVPKEKRFFDQGQDLTWKKTFDFFEKKVKEKKNSLESDRFMNNALNLITKGISSNEL